MSGLTLVEEREDTLVSRAVGGDQAAFTKLYDRYFDRVFRHAYRRTGRLQDAEDVTQRVFLKAWQALGRYRQSGSSMLAWLLTITHNEAVNFQRRTRPVQYLEFDVPETAPEADPEYMAEVQSEQVRLRRVIAKLRPDQQKVITMRFLDYLDTEDVARALGKTNVNVRVIQHRALERLRTLLEQEDTDFRGQAAAA